MINVELWQVVGFKYDRVIINKVYFRVELWQVVGFK